MVDAGSIALNKPFKSVVFSTLTGRNTYPHLPLDK